MYLMLCSPCSTKCAVGANRLCWNAARMLLSFFFVSRRKRFFWSTNTHSHGLLGTRHWLVETKDQARHALWLKGEVGSIRLELLGKVSMGKGLRGTRGRVCTKYRIFQFVTFDLPKSVIPRHP